MTESFNPIPGIRAYFADPKRSGPFAGIERAQEYLAGGGPVYVGEFEVADRWYYHPPGVVDGIP